MSSNRSGLFVYYRWLLLLLASGLCLFPLWATFIGGLPLSRPILATVGVLALIGSRNEYLLPLVMINSETLYPWPLGILQYQGQYGTDWGKVLAFVSLTLTPALIFYLMAQKHIIAGLTAGAVKG